MTIRTGRTLLLQAASVLALSAGTAFAGGLSLDAQTGAGVSVGSEAGIGASVGSGTVADAGIAGDGGAAIDVEAGTSAAVAVEAGGESEPADGSDGTGSATAESAGTASGEAEAESSLALSDDRTDGEASADVAASSSARLGVQGWTLAEFSGKRVHDEQGQGVGTVESVAVDMDNDVHLVTALDAADRDGHELAIPLDRVQVNASGDAFVLARAAGDVESHGTDLATAGEAFTMIKSDAELQALLASN